MAFGTPQGSGGGGGGSGGSSVSDVNTSTSALGSGATFTGEWERSPSDGVTVSCKTDNSGTLYFDFSNDGTNADTFPSNGFDVASGIHEYHTARVNSRFFRVRLVNDSGAQSYLRLYTYYGSHTAPNAPLNQTLGADADSTVIRFQDPAVDLALGRLGGVTEVDVFGDVESLDAADAAADIWHYGSDGLGGTPVHPFPTTSAVARMASSSGSDTVDMVVTYIDSAGAEQTATYTLTGQTPVVLPSMTHVNEAYNDSATQLAGDVTISHDTDWTNGLPDDKTETLAYVASAHGKTSHTHYVVGTGNKAIIKRVYSAMARGSGAAGSAVVDLRHRPSGKSWLVERHLHISHANNYEHNVILVLNAGDAVCLRVDDVSDTDTNVQGEIDMDLVPA